MKKTHVILSLYVLCLAACREKGNSSINPRVAPITEAVFSPGHIEAKNQFTLTAMSDGYITSVPVSEGDLLQNGQLVLSQDQENAAIQQQTASSNLAFARDQAASNSAVLQQLRAQLSSAVQKTENSKVQLERMERLYQTHSVSRTDLESAQLTYDNAVNSEAVIRQNIEATQQELDQSVINNRGQARAASLSLENFETRSPGDFMVYQVLKKKGEFARKGEAIALLGDAREMTISLTIDETSIRKIKPGQKVLIQLNTEIDTTYIARISKIYPLFDAASQTYKVEAVFDRQPPHLVNGTMLQANIIVAEKNEAFLIPANYLMGDGIVIRKNGSGTDSLKVQTGIRSTEWVEITGGLTLKDRIVKPD